MKHLKINKSDLGSEKIFIISDIHGCHKTLLALFEKINPSKDDSLFFLGDYINRGPKSKEVVDFIIDLKNKDYKVFTLRGNHEDMAHNGRIHQKHEMNNPDGTPKSKYLDFLKSLNYIIEIDDTILVHAGLNFRVENPFEDFKSMMWINKTRIDLVDGFEQRIIYGHKKVAITDIQDSVRLRRQLIPLDNGCYRKDQYPLGNLCCLELNEFELHIQKNVDEMPVENTLE